MWRTISRNSTPQDGPLGNREPFMNIYTILEIKPTNKRARYCHGMPRVLTTASPDGARAANT